MSLYYESKPAALRTIGVVQHNPGDSTRHTPSQQSGLLLRSRRMKEKMAMSRPKMFCTIPHRSVNSKIPRHVELGRVSLAGFQAGKDLTCMIPISHGSARTLANISASAG